MALLSLIVAGILGIIITIRNSTKPIEERIVSKDTKAVEKTKNPAAGLNILLYIGTYLLLVAIFVFANNYSAYLVQPIIMFLTVLFYLGGVLLFKSIKHLKPVGAAFISSGLIMLPFWCYSFQEFGCSVSTSAVLSTGICAVIYALSAFILNSRICATLSPVFLTSFIVSLCGYSDNEFVTITALGVAPIIVALPLLYAWRKRVSWLPVVFRSGSILLSYILPAFSTIVLCFTLQMFGTKTEFGFARTITGIALFVYLALNYAWSKNRKTSILLRFGGMACLMAILFDITDTPYGYDVLSYDRTSFDSLASFRLTGVRFLGSAIIGFLTILGALLSSMRNNRKLGIDVLAVIVGAYIILFNLFLTNIILEGDMKTFINIAVWGLVAVLGAVYTIGLKNVFWSVASSFALIAILDTIGSDIITWSNLAALITYAAVGFLPVSFYLFSRKISAKSAFWVAISNIVIFSLMVTSKASSLDYQYVGMAVVSAYLFALAGMARNKNVAEAGFYALALALCYMVGNIIDSMIPSCNTSTDCLRGDADSMSSSNFATDCIYDPCSGVDFAAFSALKGFLIFQIIGLTILGMSVWREYKQTRLHPRAVIGVSWLSIGILFFVLPIVIDHITGSTFYAIAFLVEEIIFLVLGTMKKRAWLCILSVIAIIFDTILLAFGNTYAWLAILGVGIIGFVAWRLSIINKREKLSEGEKK